MRRSVFKGKVKVPPGGVRKGTLISFVERLPLTFGTAGAEFSDKMDTVALRRSDVLRSVSS